MDAKDYIVNFWKSVDARVLEKGINMTILSDDLGLRRETIYCQKRRHQLPRPEQLLAMQEYLGMNNQTESPFAEYIPYLEKANSATLFAIRKLLDMPEKKTAVEIVV